MILSLVRVIFLQPLNKLYNLIEILNNSSIICQGGAQKTTVIWQSLFFASVLALLNAVRVPGSALGWLVVYLQTLQNVDLSSYKNFLIALYFFAIKNRVRAHQHKIFLLTFAVELEWWC